MYDKITKPHHYGWHPSGVEAKEVTDDLPRWLGDAIAYIWRRNHKGQPIDDRLKAIERLNEATPKRLRKVKKDVTKQMSYTVINFDNDKDRLIREIGMLISGAYWDSSVKYLQAVIDDMKSLLQAELDELTRTPTTYEEQ